jgi:hypothetical protein
MNFNTETLKRIGIGLACLVAGFLIGSFALTIPKPTITDADGMGEISIVKGTTRPNTAVVAFDGAGTYLATVMADASGAFSFDTLPAVTGTSYVLRVMDGGWRASPPLTVLVEDESIEPDFGVTGEELPPGVPPTSSARSLVDHATTTASASSTQSMKTPKVLIATATLSNMNPKAGSSMRVTAEVRDENQDPIPGATVVATIRYPSGPAVATLKGDGSYAATVKVPDDLVSGMVVVVDVSASYQALSSTARATFTVK